MQYGTNSIHFVLTALLFLISSFHQQLWYRSFNLIATEVLAGLGLQTVRLTKPKLLKCLLRNLFFLSAYSTLSFLSWTRKLKKTDNNTVFSRCEFCNQRNDIIITSHADTLLGTSLPLIPCMYGLNLSWGHLKLVCHFRWVTSYLFLVSG